jgi:ankyrin repeat protein
MSRDLFAAIKQHDTARVKALLEGGANPNEPRAEGRGLRPLQEAIFALCDGGEVDMLQVLIEHGADVNAWDVERDQTPLLTAVCEREVAALEVLVRAGADPNVRSGGGDTPLRICADSGYLAMAALLLYAGAARTINDWGGISGYTALGLAALRLDLPMVKLLLAAGADPRAPDEDKRPAHYCMPPRAESDSQTWDAVFELLGGAKDRMPL